MKKIVPSGTNLIPSNAERVFEGKIFDVYQWRQEMFDGSFATYENLRRPDTVLVIAIDDGKIIINDSNQPHRGHKYELPGGRVDANDESILAAAKREMLEETGYEFSDWKLLDVIKPQQKMEWFVYTFLAMNKTKVGQQNLDEDGEQINLLYLNYDDAMRKLRKSGEYVSVLENAGSTQGIVDLDEFRGETVDIEPKTEMR
ncbi:MAG TPA: NUDIX hydrolase [Candidatus Saccharibacteria bacterium]|nr:NUDIX hydrolase [Candidatus Saccharibacteria bacterium]